MTAPIEGTIIRCRICNAPGGLERIRNPHPECPDLVLMPPGWWLGYVGDVNADGLDIVQVICVCSERCAHLLVREGLERDSG